LHVDRLVDLRHLELQIDAANRIYRDFNAWFNHGSEARSRDGHLVRSGLQVVEDVDAVFVGSDLAADAGGGVERDHGGRRNSGAGCVCYISG